MTTMSLSSIVAICLLIATVCSGRMVQDPIPPVHLVKNVPYHRQLTDYACGAASLQMVLEYWAPGVVIDQRSIMDVARTSADNGTLSHDILRTGHFSVLSSAATQPWQKQWVAQGFPEKPLGYASFTYDNAEPWLDEMRALLAADIPVIVLQRWALNDTEGHYRVVVGYDTVADKMVMYDPWDRDGQPRVYVVRTSDFVTLWNKTELTDTTVSPRKSPFIGVAMLPWSVKATATRAYEEPLFKYLIKAEAEYPCPVPFNCSLYQADNVLARLLGQTPVDGSMFVNSNIQALVGSLTPSEKVSYAWEVTCTSPSQAACDHAFVQASYIVRFQGIIQGSVPATYCCAGNVNWPEYSYVDAIGGSSPVMLV